MSSDISSDIAQSLPTELLQEVFLLACTDGGYTGCSLSLVSRRFRSAVWPIRYHSIALYGQKRIVNFTTQYKTTCHAASPPSKIRHLFLMSHRPLRRCAVYVNDEPDKAAAAAAAIASLLALLAPDLETLTLATAFRRTDPFCACYADGFPRLRALTIASRTHVADLPNSGAVRLPAPLFPRLERLHFAMYVPNRGFEHLLAYWATLAPEVVELRLSNLPARAARVDLCTAFRTCIPCLLTLFLLSPTLLPISPTV